MGKKVKKKARSGNKDKRSVTSSSKDTVGSPNSVLQPISTNSETPNGGVVVVMERKRCPHIDKGVDLEKLSEKLKSLEPIRCEDCREGVVDKRAGKGKGNQGKKKGEGESKTVWICLDCGHFSCGGAGFPTTPQSHAVRHARQHHHTLAVKFDNPQLRWCFPCNTIIPIEKGEDGVETKNTLHKVVKLIKGRSQTPTKDAEDIWFGTGSVISGIKSETSASIDHEATSGYMARGLMNLGNTCFFNSVTQNLLAMDRLRDYFSKFEGSLMPITTSLKKLFMETGPESGVRNTVNPKSFFGCVCAKAPQFRGFQQHDSHELLRCLLDAWSSEETITRKQKKSSLEDGKSSETGPTFVDAIFGGQLSSTVSCLECCHSSTVYEPFLDLSLPVPTKKPPFRRAQPVSRAKKPKQPPKRSARIRSKVGNYSHALPDQCASKQSTRDKSSSQIQSKQHVVDEDISATDDCESLEISKTISTTNDKSCDVQNNIKDQGSGSKPGKEQNNLKDQGSGSKPGKEQNNLKDQGSGSKPGKEHNNLKDQGSGSKPGKEEASKILTTSNDTTWLDLLSPDLSLSEKNFGSDICSSSVNHVFDNEGATLTGASFNCALDSKKYAMPKGTHDASSNDMTWLDFCEPGKELDGDDLASQINVEPATQDSETEKTVQNFGVNSASADCAPYSGSNVEDEVPLQIQDSAIILLPYGDDTSSEFRGEAEASLPDMCDNKTLEFEGFGGLFDEPEAEVATVKSSEANGVQASIIVGQSSESDHEVDNSDAPVSVENCLSYFIKPELLSKDEHAWQCENCSKVLGERKIKLKKVLTPKLDTVINGCKDTNTKVGLHLSEKQHATTELGSLCNGTVGEYVPDGDEAGQLSFDTEVNSKTNGMIETRPEATNSQSENGKHEKDDSDYNPSESSNSNEGSLPQSHHSDTTEPESLQQDNDSVQLVESTSVATSSQLERSEDEETTSETLKVKRDATKTILINRAPPILTIHLKRFTQDSRGRLSKLKGHIDFRDTIDIMPYIDPRCNTKEEYKYRLVGVVEHSGSMRGGHYVAYVRGGKKRSQKMEDECGDYKWYHASDAYVCEVKLEEVLRCEAYILFYEKI